MFILAYFGGNRPYLAYMNKMRYIGNTMDLAKLKDFAKIKR